MSSLDSETGRIFLVSDGTGETGGRFLAAALHQFKKGKEVQVTKFTHLRSPYDIQHMVREARGHAPLVLHTIVNVDLRRTLQVECLKGGIPTQDLLGPLLESLSSYLDAPSREMAGILHDVNEHYFKRMEAIEFTLQHDDGRKTRDLTVADIVLLGVSRTSKTPTSVYLAQEGYKVCNVPIVIDRPLPESLFELESKRIIGLTINPDRLHEIRKERSKRMGTTIEDLGDYIDLDSIAKELAFANKLFSRNPQWHIIDVTQRSIEETAREILDLVYGRTRPILPQ